MISLPNLSASSKTPLPGQVSPRAAAAPGMALAGLGRNVTQAGQVAGSIALDIQEAENQATMSEAIRELSERQAAFESSLLDDHDYRGYARRAEEEVIRPARSLISPDMAPVVRQALTERMESWASDLRIGTNKAAQLKAIARAKTELVRTRESYIENGQLEPYLSHLSAQTYLSPEERSLEADRARRLHADREQEIDIMRDPAAWLAAHADHDPGTNPAKHRARLSLARQQLRALTADTSAEVLDLIVENKLSTPEEIDQLAADLRPAARQRLKDILADHTAGRLEARLASPDAQKTIIGQLAAGLASYQSTGEHFDADYVRLDGLMRQLNNGPLRDEFKRRLATIREGQTATIANAADLGRDRLARAFKAELFGPTEPDTPPGQTLRALLSTGLLTDHSEDSLLRRFGFTSQQAKKIARADDPAAKFRELYNQREYPNGLTPWETRVFQAIHDGASSATRFPGPQSPADTFQALEPTYKAYGDALRQFDEWTRTTPNIDADKAEKKANELIKHPQALQLQRGIITPRPAAPSNSTTGTTSSLSDFVKDLEGYSATAYDDYKQTSIGYGTRARPGETTIDRAEAEARLEAELATHRRRVLAAQQAHGYDWSPAQIDALTSFDYNTGKLERLIANGTRDNDAIAAAMPLYHKAGGKSLTGLKRRRAAELRLFLSNS